MQRQRQLRVRSLWQPLWHRARQLEGAGKGLEQGGTAVGGTFLLQPARRKGSWQSINKMSPGACKESACQPISNSRQAEGGRRERRGGGAAVTGKGERGRRAVAVAVAASGHGARYGCGFFMTLAWLHLTARRCFLFM